MIARPARGVPRLVCVWILTDRLCLENDVGPVFRWQNVLEIVGDFVDGKPSRRIFPAVQSALRPQQQYLSGISPMVSFVTSGSERMLNTIVMNTSVALSLGAAVVSLKAGTVSEAT